MRTRTKILYITYLGLLEPISDSQILSYLFKLSDHYDIHLLSFEKKQLVKNVNAFEPLQKQLQTKGIHWRRLTYHKRTMIVSSVFDIFLGTLMSFYLITRYRIPVLHARSNIPIAIGYLIKKWMPIKLLYDRRGIMGEEHLEYSRWKHNGPLHRFSRWFEKKALLVSDHIIVLTDAMNRHLKKEMKLSAPIQTIPCCVDIKRFGNVSHPPHRSEKFVFVYSGSIGTYNLIHEMFDFFKVSLQQIPNAHFLLLTQNDVLAHKILKLRPDISQAAVTITRASHTIVPQLLSSADAGLIFRKDSPTAIAASPVKMAEYLAAGLPVIALSKIGDLGMIIPKYRVGVTFDRYHPDEYRLTIQKLCDLMSQPNGVKEHCRAISQRYFSLERAADAYNRVYRILSA